ncbi:MAG: hypothetical protein K6B69_04110 [Lachnospiraceae bacterium]|nr:hypothetical protein [Lachnospiraceae bacterium]
MEALDLLRMASAIGFQLTDFELHTHTSQEIRREKAKLTPMLPSQRRDLYQLLSASSVYRLKCKYDELSYQEGAAIIDFLHGKSATCLEMLIDLSDRSPQRTVKETEQSPDRRAEKEMFFRSRIAEYPLNTQMKLDHCRELLNRLGQLGIAPEKLQEAQDELKASLSECAVTKKKLDESKAAYHDLKRLAYVISLAEDPQFTRGPLYDKEKAPAVEKTTTDKADRMTEDSLPKEKRTGTAPTWSMPDPFFNRS